tara:strand:+ start:1602 stop:2204 length:603 start_codon:yes stop_codon:yes gene_type:complete
MKKLITLLDNILINYSFLKLFFLLIFLPTNLNAYEKWVLDKNISTIEFELPVLFAKNVKGKFNDIEGIVEIDVDKKINNKAIFSVRTNDVEMNYTKYKNLLLSDIFFDSANFPLAVVDTKKFSYKNEEEINLDVEITIKGKSEIVPLKIFITKLAEELYQIKSELVFSRTMFKIGTGKWKNTSILKDKVKLKTNLFLFRE